MCISVTLSCLSATVRALGSTGVSGGLIASLNSTVGKIVKGLEENIKGFKYCLKY